MIELRPFRAWRPVPDKAVHVCSRSYVSYTPEQLHEKLTRDPYTFLHVIHPQGTNEIDLPREDRFSATRQAFQRFCEQGILIRDQAPSIHVYEQHAHGNTSIGIITGVSVHAYLNGRIKAHEQTLTAREELFTEYLEATGINAEPVLLATPPGTDWQVNLRSITAKTPTYDFITGDGVHHRIWSSSDPDLRRELQEAFARIPALYIADGHHRMASSARLAQKHGIGDVDPMAWCLAYIVPHDQLFIYNYDRAVTELGGLSSKEFLDRLSSIGKLTPLRSVRSAPGTIAVRTSEGWHRLEMPAPPDGTAPDARLDAARFCELVLGPVLGIHDLRNDRRIRFIPGTEGVQALDDLIENGRAQAAFHLHPVSFAELRAVADAGGTMPPKSTYIEPKLRSGITIYSLEDV